MSKSTDRHMNNVKFIKILSMSTHYGIIWLGTYINKPCIIKMVRVESSVKPDSSIFRKDDNIPYLHREFKNRKQMTREKFNYEVAQLKLLSEMRLAPVLFDAWICEKLFSIKYGFIVMERMDCSVKDILLKRNLKREEQNLIDDLIDIAHHKYKVFHGDMKPSNIGVYLDSRGYIRECIFLDCAKVRNLKKYDKNVARRMVIHDNHVYDKHIDKNTEQRKIMKNKSKKEK